jgi:hypothetical protein
MPFSFCLFWILILFYSTYIHSITFIQYIYPTSFAEVPLHLLIAGQLSGKNLPWGAEQRIELGPAIQQADALYQLSYAALSWASPHPNDNDKIRFCNIWGPWVGNRASSPILAVPLNSAPLPYSLSHLLKNGRTNDLSYYFLSFIINLLSRV